MRIHNTGCYVSFELPRIGTPALDMLHCPPLVFDQCFGSGIRCLFDPWIRVGKKSGSGSGINNPDHISESLETIFWVKIPYLNYLMWIRNGINSYHISESLETIFWIKILKFFEAYRAKNQDPDPG
jgi:hypothetical protein